jgi:AAA+ superfamily predicted ATPase
MRTVADSLLPPHSAQIRAAPETAGKNTLIVSAFGKRITFFCWFSPDIPEAIVRVSPAVLPDSTAVSVEFAFVDPQIRLEKLRVHPKYRFSLIGLPVIPGSSTFFHFQNRVHSVAIGDSEAPGFVGSVTVCYRYDQVPIDRLTNLPTDAHISARILNLIRRRKLRISKTLLICGESGTGKTHLLKYMQHHVVECRTLNLLRFIDDVEGGTSEHVNSVLGSFAEGVLLVDDVCIASNEFANRLTDELTKLNDLPIIIIGTSRSPTFSLPMAFQKFFPFALTLNSLSPTARKEIIRSLTNFEATEIDLIARETSGLTRGELTTVCQLLKGQSVNREKVQDVLRCLSVSERPLQMPATNVRFAGYESILNELRLFLKVTFSEDQNGMALLQYSGILLHGASGNGKSLLVKKLNEEFEVPFFVLELDKVFSKYFGESEKSIRDVFNSARFFAPCVILIEDVDAIGGKRTDESGVGGRVLSTLLNEIDGISATRRVLTIATTNALSLVDSALLRPGRFDRLIEVPHPSRGDRIQLFDSLRSSTPVSESMASDALADLTDGFTCADITSLFRFAALNALREEAPAVGSPHLEAGLQLLNERRQSLASVAKVVPSQ